MNDDYKPRFGFEITYEQKERADRVLDQYGLRKAIFGIILDDVCDLIEDHGGLAIGILMSGQAKPREILPSMNRVEQVIKKIGE